jgi:threonine dehydrogenase-like Zn-dependent dehydrogenase
MRAMVLRGGQQLAVEEIQRPVPAPGWVLVKVRACGICGSDLHMARYADERVAAARAAVLRAAATGGARGEGATAMLADTTRVLQNTYTKPH